MKYLFFLIISLILTSPLYSDEELEPAFKSKPNISKDGEKILITFSVTKATDVEISILDKDQSIIRHLVAGTIGKGSPTELLKTGLKQDVLWDKKSDNGKPASNGPFTVRVRLGFGVKFDGFIGENPYHIGGAFGLATDTTGNLYIYSTSTGNRHPGGTPYLLKFDRKGQYLKTLMPLPANLPKERANPLGMIPSPGKYLVPKNLQGTWPVFYKPGSISSRVHEDGSIIFFSWLNISKVGGDGGATKGLFNRSLWAKGKKPRRGHWRYKFNKNLAFAVSSDGKTVYATGLHNKKEGGSHPKGRIYKVSLTSGGLKTFIDLPEKNLAHSMAFDKDGNLLLGLKSKIIVLDPSGKEIGSLPCPQASQIHCHRKTGEIYVLTIGKRASYRAKKSIIKYSGWKDGKELVRYPLKKLGGRAVMALDDSSDKTVLWVSVERTKGANPFNLGANALLIRLEETENVFKPTEHGISVAEGPMGVVTRLAVHPENDLLIARGEYSKAAGYNGLTGELIKLPFKDCLDMSVGLDKKWYIQPGNNWAGRIYRYKKDLTPDPVPGKVGTKKVPANAVGFAFGRYGHGFGTGGLTADANGRIFCLNQTNEQTIAGDCVHVFDQTGKPETHKRMVNHPKIVKHHKYFSSALFGPISSVVGNIAVDWKGNLYLALRSYPMDHKAPAGFAKDPGYWSCTGTIVKIKPEGGQLMNIGGKGTRPPVKAKPIPEGMQGIKLHRKLSYPSGNYFCENATKTYPGIGSMSGGFGAGCRCRQPMFQLDGWGRLFIPNAITYSVQVVDNEGNEISKFGHYGNADSRGEEEKSPIKTPAIPLGWPEAVGVSKKAIYIADVLNRRIVRLKKTYLSEVTLSIPE